MDTVSALAIRQLALFSALFVRPASGSSAFYPNCTLPSSIVNYVSSPGVRGTLDILWSSLFTMLICTWTVQHLNVPNQTSDLSMLERGSTRLKWMLVTLIVPEFLVGKALQDFMMALKSCRDMKKFSETNEVEWTLTHAYYANMGGFVFKVDGSLASSRAEREISPDTRGQRTTLCAHSSTSETRSATNSEIDGARVKLRQQVSSRSQINADEEKAEQEQLTSRPELAPPTATASITRPDQTETSLSTRRSESIDYAYPNADQLYILRDLGKIPRLPQVTVREIEAKSKGDAFVKGTAILQVLWLVIQVIVRGIKHLPVSQIEITVIAFAACTLLTYGLSWAKPQNVTVADVASNAVFTREDFKNVENPKGQNRGGSWFRTLILHHEINIFKPIPNDSELELLPGTTFFSYMDAGMVIAGTIFGGLHLIAWNFHFPTPIECLLWKVAAVYLAAALPIFYGLAYLPEKLGILRDIFFNPDALSNIMGGLVKLLVSFPMLSYLIARLCLMVLIFRCLFFLDPETFVTTWEKEVPHLQ